MKVSDANRVLRSAIIKEYFIPGLKRLGFSDSEFKHPRVDGFGLSKGPIHLFFDIETGCEYGDGDEWFMVEYILPFDELPDELKSPEYFTRMPMEDGYCWRHRELIRYRRGKAKRLDEALSYLNSKAEELIRELEERGLTSSTS